MLTYAEIQLENDRLCGVEPPVPRADAPLVAYAQATYAKPQPADSDARTEWLFHLSSPHAPSLETLLGVLNEPSSPVTSADERELEFALAALSDRWASVTDRLKRNEAFQSILDALRPRSGPADRALSRAFWGLGSRLRFENPFFFDLLRSLASLELQILANEDPPVPESAPSPVIVSQCRPILASSLRPLIEAGAVEIVVNVFDFCDIFKWSRDEVTPIESPQDGRTPIGRRWQLYGKLLRISGGATLGVLQGLDAAGNLVAELRVDNL